MKEFFAKYHTYFFAAIMLVLALSIVSIALADGVKAVSKCVYKEKKYECALVEIQGENYIILRQKDKVIAIYKFKQEVSAVLIYEYGEVI